MNRIPRGGIAFINFFLSGMIMWLFFNGIMMRSATLISSKVNLLGQVKFPREALVFVLFSEKLVDFFISFVILLMLNAISGYYPNWAFIYIPLVLLTFFTMGLGGMFLLATVGLFIRDVPQIISLLLRLLFYFSGIIFPADILPERAVQILSFNPIFFLVESFRNIIFFAEVPNVLSVGIWLILSITILFIGFSLFTYKNGVFADYK
jgi:lipopolysaccharide transport system permease protein